MGGAGCLLHFSGFGIRDAGFQPGKVESLCSERRHGHRLECRCLASQRLRDRHEAFLGQCRHERIHPALASTPPAARPGSSPARADQRRDPDRLAGAERPQDHPAHPVGTAVLNLGSPEIRDLDASLAFEPGVGRHRGSHGFPWATHVVLGAPKGELEYVTWQERLGIQNIDEVLEVPIFCGAAADDTARDGPRPERHEHTSTWQRRHESVGDTIGQRIEEGNRNGDRCEAHVRASGALLAP